MKKWLMASVQFFTFSSIFCMSEKEKNKSAAPAGGALSTQQMVSAYPQSDMFSQAGHLASIDYWGPRYSRSDDSLTPSCCGQEQCCIYAGTSCFVATLALIKYFFEPAAQ